MNGWNSPEPVTVTRWRAERSPCPSWSIRLQTHPSKCDPSQFRTWTASVLPTEVRIWLP